MTWRGLPPFRNGVRVVPYFGGMVRVDIGTIHDGFDVPVEKFGDDAEIAARLRDFPGVTVAMVRAAA